jgi:hypothetical protein
MTNTTIGSPQFRIEADMDIIDAKKPEQRPSKVDRIVPKTPSAADTIDSTKLSVMERTSP